MSGGSGLIVSGVPRAAPPNTRNQLWHVSYPDGEPYQITNDPSGYSSLSLTANSRTLLTQQTTLYSNIWVVPGDDPSRATQITNSTAELDEFAWMPDGRIVDFPATRAGVTNIWRLPLDGGAEKQITTWKTDAPLYWLGWSRDGKQLAVVRDNSTTDLVLIQNFR
jgi:hypothetical protein